MALSQVQIIQSLADALRWFEKELEWGVSPAELNHLTGRIGELYVAMITRGQMALETNQRGYDVISSDNDRVSVKTITSSNHVKFNQNTFDQVDRIFVLKLNIDEEDGISVETLLDTSAKEFMQNYNGKYTFSTAQKTTTDKPIEHLQIKEEALTENYLIRRYENDTIRVLQGNEFISPAKPILRKIAAKIGVVILNGSSQPKNTRQLGADIIKILNTKNISH